MPRQSASAAQFANVTGKRPRLTAPDDLSEAARRVWNELIESLDSEHFAPSDAPLLRSYCEACAMADLAASELATSGPVVNGKASPWLIVQEKQVRAQTALSARLRLSPQSRFSRNKAGTTLRGGPSLHPKPWSPVPDYVEVDEHE